MRKRPNVLWIMTDQHHRDARWITIPEGATSIIPQAILKQVSFGEEVEMDVADGKITLKRVVDPSMAPDFTSIEKLDDPTIQRVLRKISGTDLITALIGADESVKEAVYRNLSERARDYAKQKVDLLERGDARDIIIEASRTAISEALMQVMAE